MQKLTNALQAITDEYSFQLKDLQNAYHKISTSYQQNSNAPISSILDALAYAVVRMPATLSVIKRVLKELPNNYIPSSILDLGCGPGSSLLACESLWLNNMPSITCVDENQYMLEIAKRLSSQVISDPIKFEQSKLTNISNHQADITLLSYVLGEIPQELDKILMHSWDVTRDFLIIILPGTPKDFKLLIQARELLINMGGAIVAPCPHSQNCPLQAYPNDWCHFSERLQRSKMHRDIKLGTQIFEDEKFCYVVASKKSYTHHTRNRIIKKPLIRGGHITLDLCTNEGIQRQTFGKKDPQFKSIKKRQWGDIV